MIKHILENTKENVMAVSEGSRFMEIETDEKIVMVFEFVIKIDGEGNGLCVHRSCFCLTNMVYH